jgi:hypothetical protein
MSKKTFLVTSFILTLISTGYIFLSYFGIVRYFTLQIQPIETYSKEYQNLEKASKKDKIVISLGSNRSQIDNMKSMLSSLFDQTVKVDEIAVNVPPDCVDLIPRYMNKYTSVYKLGADYGQNNNIIPTLKREKDKNTIVIILENNIIYGKDFISELVDKFLEIEKKEKNLIMFVNDQNGLVVNPMISRTSNFNSEIVNLDKNSRIDSNLWINSNLNENIKKEKFFYKENFKSFKTF